MTERMPMTSCFGKQTFSASTTQVMVVGWPLQNVDTDNPLDYRDSMFLQKMLRNTGSNAVMAGSSKHHGHWYFYTFNQPEDEYLIQITVRKRVERVETAHACLLFYLTPRGNPIGVGIHPVPDVDAALQRVAVLYAKGYVVTPKQCESLWGLSIPKNILSHKFIQEEVDEDFLIDVVGGGTPHLPMGKNLISGEVQVMKSVAKRPRRRLSI